MKKGFYCFNFNDSSPLSTIGMPYYSQPLLSQWPNNFNSRIGKNPNKIPPEVLKNVKMVDFVGYSPNPRTFRRNQAFTQEFEEGPKKPKFRSEQELEQMKTGTKRKVHVDDFISSHILRMRNMKIIFQSQMEFHFTIEALKLSIADLG